MDRDRIKKAGCLFVALPVGFAFAIGGAIGIGKTGSQRPMDSSLMHTVNNHMARRLFDNPWPDNDIYFNTEDNGYQINRDENGYFISGSNTISNEHRFQSLQQLSLSVLGNEIDGNIQLIHLDISSETIKEELGIDISKYKEVIAQLITERLASWSIDTQSNLDDSLNIDIPISIYPGDIQTGLHISCRGDNGWLFLYDKQAAYDIGLGIQNDFILYGMFQGRNFHTELSNSDLPTGFINDLRNVSTGLKNELTLFTSP